MASLNFKLLFLTRYMSRSWKVAMCLIGICGKCDEHNWTSERLKTNAHLCHSKEVVTHWNFKFIYIKPAKSISIWPPSVLPACCRRFQFLNDGFAAQIKFGDFVLHFLLHCKRSQWCSSYRVPLRTRWHLGHHEVIGAIANNETAKSATMNPINICH